MISMSQTGGQAETYINSGISIPLVHCSIRLMFEVETVRESFYCHGALQGGHSDLVENRVHAPGSLLERWCSVDWQLQNARYAGCTEQDQIGIVIDKAETPDDKILREGNRCTSETQGSKCYGTLQGLS